MIFLLKVIIAERFFWVARGSWKQQAWFDKIKTMTAFVDHRKTITKAIIHKESFLSALFCNFFYKNLFLRGKWCSVEM